MRTIEFDGTLGEWRAHARALVQAGVAPAAVRFRDALRGGSTGEGGLFGALSAPPPDGPALALPRSLVERIRTVACHRSPGVWDVLYAIVFRVARGERDLLGDSLDPDVVAFGRLEKAVQRDAHKMHAFVRFRRVADPKARNGERFVAWYRPSHLIAEREAPFFQSRFPSMDWSILTPDASIHWDGERVRVTAGAPREAAPDGDALEELWCAYYASIFNPARVKLAAMRAEMPKKFWDVLPETAQLPQLLADVPRRLEAMARTSRAMADSAKPFVPAGGSLAEIAEALQKCEGCELCRNGTSAVAGAGPSDARIVLLGEQPGDVEEQRGEPFVGPAGRELEAALRAAGLELSALYLTNSVKHFRHEPRGKRRLHKRPTIEHVSRCQPWLDVELEAIRPAALVCLGVTAGRAVFGPTHRAPATGDAPTLRSSRYAPATFTTFHPAAILRAESPERANALRAHLMRTLRAAAHAAD